jgi:hypothetical protein
MSPVDASWLSMSVLKSGLIGLVFASLAGVSSVVGCSADGSGSFVDVEPTEPDEGGAQLPASTSGGTSGSSGSSGSSGDGGTKPPKDAGKDAPVDAGPPPPAPGTACTTIDEVKKKACGACGTQSTVCLADGASGGKWTEYSPCENELVGGCIPGTVVDEACGNCGTMKKTCTQYCAFSATACNGQPASSCVPGGVDLSNAGCPTPDVFRRRSCSSTCAYDNFSMACDAPPTIVEVGPTMGSVTSTVAILTQGQTLSRMTGTCPTATFATGAATPYVYVRVHNPLAKAATVAIYNSLATGGVAYKTVLAAYAGAAGPTDEATRKTCLKGAATYGTTALTGDSKFASLDGTRAVTIAPGATVSVYVAAYNTFDPLKPADSTGKVKLNVQTMSLE